VLFDDQHRAVLVAQTQRQREANYACANDDDVPVLHLSIVVQRDAWSWAKNKGMCNLAERSGFTKQV